MSEIPQEAIERQELEESFGRAQVARAVARYVCGEFGHRIKRRTFVPFMDGIADICWCGAKVSRV